jgi:hypothetical protein
MPVPPRTRPRVSLARYVLASNVRIAQSVVACYRVCAVISQAPTFARLIRTVAQPWIRGPKVRHAKGWVELDRDGLEEYVPITEPNLVFDLAAVRTPSDAVEFVRSYGLLRHGKRDGDLRESFADWEQTAVQLSALLRLASTLQAAAAGDADALRALRDVFEPAARPHFAERATTDADILAQMSVLVAWMLSSGLEGCQERVEAEVEWRLGADGGAGPPAQFQFAVEAPDLVGHAYHAAALLVTNRYPLAACEEDGRFFLVEDPRQRFCSPRCAARARRRRWVNTRRQQSAAEQE